jgi:hypothetical protein
MVISRGPSIENRMATSLLSTRHALGVALASSTVTDCSPHLTPVCPLLFALSHSRSTTSQQFDQPLTYALPGDKHSQYYTNSQKTTRAPVTRWLFADTSASRSQTQVIQT